MTDEELKELEKQVNKDTHNGITILQLLSEVQRLNKKLEKEMDLSFKLEGQVNDLNRENQRLREALGFYANQDNWDGINPESSLIHQDGGERARKVLGVKEDA